MRVLVAEDDALLGFMISEILEEAGHEVAIMSDCAERALQLAEEVDVDVAFVNIHLRDGERAGLELASQLAEKFNVLSLFVSGQVKEARTLSNVALGYLAKPISSADIKQTVKVVEALLEGNPPQPESVPRSLELFRKLD